MKGYGLWGTADLWVMVCISLPTKLVDSQGYGGVGHPGRCPTPSTGVRCNRLADRLHPLWHTRRTGGKTLAASDLVSPQPARTG